MLTLRLCQVVLPPAFLEDTLGTVAPGITYSNITNGTGIIAQDGDRTVAVIDPTTGETTFYPRYEGLNPSFEISTERNITYIDNPDLFPVDDLNITVIQGPNLYGAVHTQDGNESNAAPYLSHVFAQRVINLNGNELGVRGPGSKAMLGFGANHTLQSFNYLWHPAKRNSTIKPNSVVQIHDAILAQLGLAAQLGPLTVDAVEACYYDSAASHIQPVYWFSATRNLTSSGNGTQFNARISGYVPVGSYALEPLPNLLAPPLDTVPPAIPSPPSTPSPPPSTIQRRSRSQLTKRAPTVTVGRYVIQQDDAGWLASAQNFWPALTKYAAGKVNFVSQGFYWAYPWLYTTNAAQFANSVTLLLTEAHGNWDKFSTYQQERSSVVNIGDIPSTGYGAGSGGALKFWVLHSCEVIPSNTDYPNDGRGGYSSFDVWWSVFNGLHAVMGYRTEMWIHDGVTTPFGQAVGNGVSVVGAWMSAVLNDQTWYKAGKGNMYLDGNRGIQEPMGRASSVSVCGHTDDVVWDGENLGRPGCLFEWWYDN